MKINLSKLPSIILITTILIFIAARFYNLNYNSIFLDEAIYIVLGKNIIENPLPNALPLTWVGGVPILFPFFSAIFYEFFGVIGSRAFTALLGTASIYFMYRIGYNLFYAKEKEFPHFVGLISALFLSFSSIHLWLSRFAIYDMLAFLLFTIGFSFALEAFRERLRKKYLISSIFFILAFFAKYSAILILPALIILFLLNAYFYKKKELPNILFWIGNIFLGIGAYILIFFEEFSTFISSQAVGAGTATITEIITIYLSTVGIWYLLGVIGVVWNLISKNYFIVLLFIFSLIPPISNIAAQNSTTIEQNALYSLLILIPLAASVPAFILMRSKTIGIILIIVITVSTTYFFTLPQLYSLTQFWPNTNEAMNVLRENVTSSDIILSETGDITVLALEEIVPSDQIISPFFFQYENAEGEEAYIQALENMYFSIVMVENTNGQFYESISKQLESGYKLIYEQNGIAIYERP